MSIPAAPLLLYSQPHQFEPLLPQRNLDELSQATRQVMEKSFRLQGAMHAATRQPLRELVRAMNSYYSNLIEGQGTHPRHIDRALRQDFSHVPDIAQRQRLALAHIDAERALEAAGTNEAEALRSTFLQQAHAELYGRLSEADRQTGEGRAVEPGALRREDVAVGRHQPPTWQALPAFMARADAAYAKPWGLDAVLYAIASAHHRMAWTHPFLDGNGRACRLQTHCALHRVTGGLWSVNRGLARQRHRYYELLANADMPRQGDLDGRGNLSERMLRAWCQWFIEVCDDQVSFMARMLDPARIKERIAGLVLVRSQSSDHAEYRPEAVLPLHHVMTAGPLSRGEFVQMTGLGERTARKLLAQLLKDGLLASETPKGYVSIGFPLDALALLLPDLYPEAATLPPDE